MPLLAPAYSRGLRPTRRDLLLILLSFAVAYLLLATPDRPGQYVPRPRKITSFTDMFTTKSETSRRSCDAGPTFEESVQKVGFVKGNERPQKGDEENDEFEDRMTKLLGHTPGWTMFDKLYLFNGQLYVVTERREDWPPLRLLTSSGVAANSEPGNEKAREPTGGEIIFRNAREAYELWGNNVYRMRGMTWIWNDGNFIDHYYHFAAELLLGTWRVHATQDPDMEPTGHTSLMPPARAWFFHHDHKNWRDGPRFNPTILYGLFPNIATLFPEDLDDLASVTRSEYRKKAYVFDRAILADRSAAFRGPYTGPTSRTVAGATAFNNVSRWWWEPVRRQMLRFAEVSEDIINRNLEGYGALDPVLWENKSWTPGPGEPPLKPVATPGNYKPVVTYISRQKSRRRLTPQSHADLVRALEQKADQGLFELIVVEAERYTKEEQLAIAGKTTIMLGVHGNGLTHLLWMPPTPRSAVIEMFCKGGFARDYQWTAHALGIRHFAVQHDQYHSSPNEPRVNYPEGEDGFQGTRITVDAKVVADLIEGRLKGTI